MALYMVIADDLSGASDVALPFVTSRFGVSATIGIENWPDLKSGMVAISTETRESTPEQIRSRISRTFREVVERNPDVLLKKIDSQLRGSIGAELDAAREAADAPFVALAPALPRIGRTVTAGRLRLASDRGSEVDESGTEEQDGKSSDWHEISVTERIAASSDLETTVVAADNDVNRLANSLAEAGRTADVVSYDSTTFADIQIFLQAALRLNPRPLLAGTAALARALAVLHGGRTGRGSTLSATQGDPEGTEPAERRILYVLGSHHVALRRQIETLIHERGLTDLALSSFRKGDRGPISGSLILESVRDGVDSPDHGETARELGRAAKSLNRAAPFDGVVCAGGAVAAGVAAEFGITTLEVLSEITEGFALTRPNPDALAPPYFALRPGSYGASNDLVMAHDKLTREDS